MDRTLGEQLHASQGDCFNPIIVAVRPLLVDAILPDGSPLGQDEPVLELAFARPLDRSEQYEDTVRAFLGEIATDLDDEVYEGVRLPKHVASYTFGKLARLARRAFGFMPVDVMTPVPEVLAADPFFSSYKGWRAVFSYFRRKNDDSEEAILVYMATSDFLDRYAQRA